MPEPRASSNTPDDRRQSATPPVLERLLVLRPTLLLLALAWLLAVLMAAGDELGVLQHGSSLSAVFLSIIIPPAAVMALLSVRRQKLARQDDESDPALDPLTSLPVGRYFVRRLGDEVRRAHRLGRILTLVVVDVNNVDAVNREYGRDAGDEVLRLVARAVQKSKRYTDLSSRLGDDEFAVMLPDCDARGASSFVARVEERLAREPATIITRRRPVTVWTGVCAGVAELRPDIIDHEQFLDAAMVALSDAREERDRRRRAWSA